MKSKKEKVGKTNINVKLTDILDYILYHLIQEPNERLSHKNKDRISYSQNALIVAENEQGFAFLLV